MYKGITSLQPESLHFFFKPGDLIEFIIQNMKGYDWGFKEFCNDLILAIYACMHEQGT